MGNMSAAPADFCPVCASPYRYQIEQAHLDGGNAGAYGISSAQLRRHMNHVADRTTLDLVTGLTSATSLAARMQQLASASEAIFALALEQQDGKLALAALREARQTLQAMADLGAQVATLSGAHGDSSERPDLDDQISDWMGNTRSPNADGTDESSSGVAPIHGHSLPSAERRALPSPTDPPTP